MFNPYLVLAFGWTVVAVGAVILWLDSRGRRSTRASLPARRRHRHA